MTTKNLKLPDNVGPTPGRADDRLFAPSAVRNFQAIRDVLARHLPATGKALEIASGTGEHITRLGQQFPQLTWQPTDIVDSRINSIAAWQATEGSVNVLAPLILDATAPVWANGFAGQDVILLVNLLHLIRDDHARNLISQSALALNPGGVALMYGPFKRGHLFASAGDMGFHHDLIRQHPEIGYKSFQQIQAWQAEAGLEPLPPIDMPANNLMLVARKPMTA